MFGVSAGPSIGKVRRLTPIGAAQRRAIVSSALLAADALACFLIFGAGSFFRVDGMHASHPGLIWLEVAAAVAIFSAAGLHSGHGRSAFERLRARTLASLAVCAATFVLQALAGSVDLAAAIMLLPPLLLVTYYAEIAVVAVLDRKGLWAERALIVGEGPRLEQLVQELRTRAVFAIQPIAVIDVAGIGEGQRPPSLADLPAVGGPRDLRLPIDLVICAGEQNLGRLAALAGDFDAGRVLLLADSAGGASLWASTRAVGSGIGIEQSRGARIHDLVRRALDIVVVALLAVPATVVVGLAIMAVRFVDPGPVFFVQRRIGMNGREFGVLKIRSMYRDSDRRLAEHLAADPRARHEWETKFKLRDDPRILPYIGGFIRRSSIDELPQLWNVLRGDMNVVGPRPFPDYHVKMFDEEFRALRTSVRPGLTGLWQVSTRSNGDLEAQKADDVFYIRNRSLWMDFYILLQTLPAVASGSGAR